VPTSGTTEWGNEIPRDQDIDAIFNAIIDDQPLPGEERAPAVTSSTTSSSTASPTPEPKRLAVDPESVSVQVSNGSGVAGTATMAANDLGSYGFGIYSVGNYSSGTRGTTEVYYSAGHESEAATVASAIPGAVAVPKAGLGSIVELVLGSDYSGTTMAPTPAGDELPSSTTRSAGSASDDSTPTTTQLPSDLDVTNGADDKCA